jgi:hypothetical protein
MRFCTKRSRSTRSAQLHLTPPLTSVLPAHRPSPLAHRSHSTAAVLRSCRRVHRTAPLLTTALSRLCCAFFYLNIANAVYVCVFVCLCVCLSWNDVVMIGKELEEGVAVFQGPIRCAVSSSVAEGAQSRVGQGTMDKGGLSPCPSSPPPPLCLCLSLCLHRSDQSTTHHTRLTSRCTPHAPAHHAPPIYPPIYPPAPCPHTNTHPPTHITHSIVADDSFGLVEPQEDALVVELVKKYGPKRWSLIAGHLKVRLGVRSGCL